MYFSVEFQCLSELNRQIKLYTALGAHRVSESSQEKSAVLLKFEIQ